MFAVIHRDIDDTCEGALPLAGITLAVRHLQALRSMGFQKIALEHSSSLREDEVSAWLVDQALATFVTLVPSKDPLGPMEVARRGGVSVGPIVALSSSSIFD